jgi:hypothetical protein
MERRDAIEQLEKTFGATTNVFEPDDPWLAQLLPLWKELNSSCERRMSLAWPAHARGAS